MKRRRQILKYIDSLRADGRYDSSGHFSVELKKAFKKSAGYELSNFESAILKLIQAGVAGGAQELFFEEGRQELVFSALGLDWDRTEIFESLYRPGEVPGATLHLGQALRYLIRHCSSALLEFSDPPAYLWKNDELEEVTIAHKTPNCFRLTLSAEHLTSEGALSRQLFSRCHSCPVPLTLDGRQANGFNNDPGSGSIPGVRTPFAQRFWETDIELLTPFRLVAGMDEAPLRLSKPNPWSGRALFPQNCSLAAFLTANIDGSPQPSFLLWTHHGVIVKREMLPPLGCVGVTMILCGDDLSVDLSGLQLIEGQLFEVQRRKALVACKNALIELAGPGGELLYREDLDSLLDRALSLVGFRKPSIPDPGPVGLDILERHLANLGTKYWSP